jgi:hypothetical protein
MDEGMPLRIKDERRQSGHFLHKLIDVLVIGLTTVIAGWDEFNVPELLDSLDVNGDTITIDAMGCRTDRAAKIREQETDYVLPVKENPPALYRETNEYFEGEEEGWGRNPPADMWRSGLEGKNISLRRGTSASAWGKFCRGAG